LLILPHACKILYSLHFLGSPESAKDAATPGAVPPGLHVPDVEIHPGNAQKHYESDPFAL
jgi:hypothetical protein